jgi:hypothetical protein
VFFYYNSWYELIDIINWEVTPIDDRNKFVSAHVALNCGHHLHTRPSIFYRSLSSSIFLLISPEIIPVSFIIMDRFSYDRLCSLSLSFLSLHDQTIVLFSSFHLPISINGEGRHHYGSPKFSQLSRFRLLRAPIRHSVHVRIRVTFFCCLHSIWARNERTYHVIPKRMHFTKLASWRSRNVFSKRLKKLTWKWILTVLSRKFIDEFHVWNCTLSHS